METTNKLTYLSTKFFTENKEKYRITVTISLDDDCHNNMCDWSVTADLRISEQECVELYIASEDELYFKYLLFSLGIVDRWLVTSEVPKKRGKSSAI